MRWSILTGWKRPGHCRITSTRTGLAELPNANRVASCFTIIRNTRSIHS
jgi:hypothetical protein